MNLFILGSLSGVSCLLSWWLTGRVRRYALDRRVLDIPNPRSSHSVATPRGGGLAIVMTTLAVMVAAAALGDLSWRHIWGPLGGGALVAVIGFVDDHRHLRRRWRLLGHFTAAVWVVTIAGGLPPIPVFDATIDLGWIGQALAAVYLVWLLNLTNFMDGIDGIAAIEVITVTFGAELLYALSGAPADDRVMPMVLAAATVGFLAWNWPPAKIFMGDAGSGFVGFLLGVLSLEAARLSPPLLWSWLILLGVFIVDTTVTLVRRAMRGERFYEAHRSHAYQHAAERRGAHMPITVAVAAINICWLLPVAVLVALRILDGTIGLVVAYTPLVAAVLWLGAGAPHTPPLSSAGRHV